MIVSCSGDIFESKAQALVNPVNCVGVMGKGLALEFRKRYVDNYIAYQNACKEQRVQIGEVLVTKTTTEDGAKYIINFPTKIHWRDRSHLEYINLGLLGMRNTLMALKIKSVAIPRLGCGLGGLNWQIVRSVVVQVLQDLDDVEIQLYD